MPLAAGPPNSCAVLGTGISLFIKMIEYGEWEFRDVNKSRGEG